MLMVISPAKTLDYQSPLATQQFTQPEYLEQAQQLVDIARKLSPADIASLMKISDKLAQLNTERFNDWTASFTPENARQAILAFKGDVYTGLQAETFNQQEFEFAQQHLRILSGLYGVLRPLDLMQPYRLEMGTRLSNPAGKDLYAFWQKTLTSALNHQLCAQGDNILLNLASDEYFNAINAEQIEGKIIKPIFLDQKKGQFKVISFYVKKARGMMCRYVIHHRLTDPAQLKQFDIDGYFYAEEGRNENEMIFKRYER